MRWLDRLLGRDPPLDDETAIKKLRVSFTKVHARTERLERELLRVNADLRRQMQGR